MTLSIIIPVYNAEATLERSLSSLFGQLTPQTELIIVDDGSTDATPIIVERFASKAKKNCRLVHQENAGVASARNRGIEIARGDYLAFLDADDNFLPGALSQILQLMKEGADIIGWDWMNETEGRVRQMRQTDYYSPEQALKNLMGGTMKWNLWLFAVKREMIDSNYIRFLPGADMGEDMGFMLKSFSCAKQVKQVHEPLYCYNASNPSSISLQLNDKRRSEVSRNLDAAVAYLQTTSNAELCKQYLPHLKLFIKLPLLIGFSFKDYSIWYQWMQEANPYAMKNTALPFRVRILQGMAAKRLWIGVWLYNCCYRFLLRFK